MMIIQFYAVYVLLYYCSYAVQEFFCCVTDTGSDTLRMRACLFHVGNCLLRTSRPIIVRRSIAQGRIRFSAWLVSCYAHVFVRLKVVIVTDQPRDAFLSIDYARFLDRLRLQGTAALGHVPPHFYKWLGMGAP